MAEGDRGRVSLRPLVPGDIGWVIGRHAALYHREYGWDWTLEGLVARILAGYVETFDPTREDGWIATLDGRPVGSIFLMWGGEPDLAKLRLLFVEPDARGFGIGAMLVRACIGRARALGYRRLTLWTYDSLVSATRLYRAEGFRLVSSAPHSSFGHDLVGQDWMLDL